MAPFLIYSGLRVMSTQIKIQGRKTKTTVLMVGEGPKDKAFLRHLQDIYVSRDGDIAVKIECASGGSPRSIVEKAIRLRGARDYDKCVVLIDQDRVLEDDRELRKRMKEHPPIQIIWIKPCMEGLLLEILKYPDFSRHNVSSSFCKSQFRLHIPIDRQTEKLSYMRLFPKATIDLCRGKIHDLDAILKAMRT